ncbi:MAG: serine/threonine-protein phosphatase [bacterium]|nr:serine/threonine-protein phosphatase [bacterium]
MITERGVDDSIPEHLARNIITVNTLSLFLSLFTFTYIVIILLYKPKMSIMIGFFIIYIMTMIGAIILNKKRNYFFSRNLFYISSVVFLSTVSVLLGRDVSFHFYLLSGTFVAFYIFPDTEKYLSYFWSFFTAFLFMGLSFWLVSNPEGYLGGGSLAAVLRALTIVGITVLFFFFTYYSHSIIEKSDAKLDEKNQQLDNQFKLARLIQQNLIPISTPEPDGLRLASIYMPLDDIGGDFYDFIKFGDPKLNGIFISDVSGHGVPAALITSMIKTLINTVENVKLSPKEFLKYLNDKTVSLLTGNNFFTAFYAILDREKKILKYSRGGHNFPFLVRNNQVIELRSRGKIMGILEDIYFEENEIQLQPGDKLVFYTDGLTETVNYKDEEFGDKILSKILIQNSEQAIHDYVQTIYSELLKFKGGRSFMDDICIVGMEIK